MPTIQRRQEFLAAAKRHYAADMLIKETYGEVEQGQFRGCSVGCFAHEIDPDNWDRGNKHAFIAEFYDYPEWLALLQDGIFKGLPNGESAKWHVQLAEVIAGLPETHDWQPALHRVHAAILRVANRTAGSAQDVVQRVLDLHERAGRGEDISSEMWLAAWSAAESAESAAWSAAMSAWSAAKSAQSAAWSAAYQEIRDAVLTAIPGSR